VAQPPLAGLQRTIRERSPRLVDENLAACAAGYEAAQALAASDGAAAALQYDAA